MKIRSIGKKEIRIRSTTEPEARIEPIVVAKALGANIREVTFVLGAPASGKSTYAQKLVDNGFERLNRDTLGGTIAGLLPRLDGLLTNNKNVVLDNLFTTAADRKPFIELCRKQNAHVSCHWIQTSIEDAQYNACIRMVDKHGKVLQPDEIKKHKDPNTFPPAVFFKYKKNFEKPNTNEGFNLIVEVPFVRKSRDGYKNKGLILDYDDTLRTTIGTDSKFPIRTSEINVLPNRSEVLKKYQNEGYILCGASNQSGVAGGELTYDQAVECFEYTNKQLDVSIDYQFCPHKIPPVSCYCRKPQVGMFVHFMEKYKFDPAQTIMVGDATSDETFAKRSGIKFIHADEFFK